MNISQVIAEQLLERKFEFLLERAVFLTTLHRLFNPGSDHAKLQSEARYDRKYALATNLPAEELLASEVALSCKELWPVEHIFREMNQLCRRVRFTIRAARRLGVMCSAVF